MSDFTFYLELGLLHVLDIKAYDHMLFLLALTVPFSFKKFKTVFWIVTFFTIGHTFSLFMSAYEIYRPDETLIETLIPVTIILTALGNIIFIGKREYNKLSSFFIFFNFWGNTWFWLWKLFQSNFFSPRIQSSTSNWIFCWCRIIPISRSFIYTSFQFYHFGNIEF